jgi:hypothetical protein
MLLFVVWLAMAWRVAGQCDASTAPSCRSQTCCGGSGGSPNPQCEWVPEQQCDPRMICNLNRKRLLANITALLGISDEQAQRDILETALPLPDAMAHLAGAVAAERKRIINGYCACNEFSCCYQGCVPQSWSQWSSCSVSCGAGTRSRSLAYNPPVCGGMACDTNYESENCYPGACPTNCQVSSWSGWTCSTTCGRRHRDALALHHCARGERRLVSRGWQFDRVAWLRCRLLPAELQRWRLVVVGLAARSGCGGGSQSRSRSITPASCGGSCSESRNVAVAVVQHGCCASNCVIGGWSAWGGCSAPCGGGSQSRSRSITPESCGGSCSTSQVSDSQSCNTGCCPQHCQVGTWSQWSACSQQCGGGTHSRTRAITVVAACGGNACPTDLSESEPCGGSCCAVNCVLGQWTAFSACSVTCGSGTRSRTRVKQSAESCGGSCDVLSESETCTANGGCCPVNCVWSAFGAWSGCSVTCGAGTQTRTRTVQSTQSCGGSCAGTASETMACMQPACALPPVDCEVSQWAQWSACTATCGATASKSRTRTTTRGGQRRHAVPVAERVGELRLWVLPGGVHCVDVVVVGGVLGDVRQRHACAHAHGDNRCVVRRLAVSVAGRQRGVLDGGVRHRLPAEHVVELEHVLAGVRHWRAATHAISCGAARQWRRDVRRAERVAAVHAAGVCVRRVGVVELVAVLGVVRRRHDVALAQRDDGGERLPAAERLEGVQHAAVRARLCAWRRGRRGRRARCRAAAVDASARAP